MLPPSPFTLILYLQDNYALMACGGSVGEGYGPMIVANPKLTLAEARKTRIAIPGTLTTAFLAPAPLRSRDRVHGGAVRQDHPFRYRGRIRRQG